MHFSGEPHKVSSTSERVQGSGSVFNQSRWPAHSTKAYRPCFQTLRSTGSALIFVRSLSNPGSMSVCGLSPQGLLRSEGKRPAAATYREALGRCPWLLPAHNEGRAASQDSRHSGASLSGCSSPASPWSTVTRRPNRRLAPLQAAGARWTYSVMLLVLLCFADCGCALAGSAAAQQPVSQAGLSYAHSQRLIVQFYESPLKRTSLSR